MDYGYFIDRDPRPKVNPCHHCARDVEAGHTCLCVPAQPRSGVVTLGPIGKIYFDAQIRGIAYQVYGI